MCFRFVYEHLFTNKSVCYCFEIVFENNTCEVSRGSVWSVEMYWQWETFAIFCNGLFMVVVSRSLFDVSPI